MFSFFPCKRHGDWWAKSNTMAPLCAALDQLVNKREHLAMAF